MQAKKCDVQLLTASFITSHLQDIARVKTDGGRRAKPQLIRLRADIQLLFQIHAFQMVNILHLFAVIKPRGIPPNFHTIES